MAGIEPEAVYTARSNGRRRRTTITLVSLVLILFFAFWYAYSYYRASVAEPTPTAAPCVTISEGSIVPSTTHVNVYNATKRNGLAASTARELRLRGFVVENVANDPKKKKVTAPAQVRFGPAGAERAKLVSGLVGKGVVMVKDTRKSETVDLVLGTAFRALTAAPTPVPTPTCTITATTPAPSPSERASPSSS
jgi:hypothetical protein